MKTLPVVLGSLMLSAACFAATPIAQHFPTADALSDPARWQKNSSGAMTILYDAAEGALIFDVTFAPKVDRWLYPFVTLVNNETLHGAEAISFEMKISEQDDYQGVREANVMIAPNKPGLFRYEAPAPGQWQEIMVTLKDAADSSKKDAKLFRLGMNPRHDLHRFAIRKVRFHGTPQPRYIQPAIATAAPGTVWLEQETPAFTINAPLAKLAYTLRDWHGAVLAAGPWPDDGASPLLFQPLPPGYYLIGASHAGEEQLPPFSFTVVINPARRSTNHRSFFGTDSAQSWLATPGNMDCPYYDGDTFKLVSELIYRAGIPHVRERLSWTDVNPTPGHYDYGNYLYNANLLHERGILISGMFHNAPAWADRKQKLPMDLRELFLFCQKTAEAFGERMGNWEFWNEQDISFAPEPVWDYAACMKAAYLGFKAARPDMTVALGAVCHAERNAYDYGLFANDLAKYTDIMNFHTYAPLAKYPRIFAEMREFMADQGIGDRQLWITECGTNAEGPASADSGRTGIKKHAPEQEMILAEFLPKSQILLMMEGVARNYYFVFPPYNERGGHKDWGLMRRDSSVKPGYAAFSTITAQLLDAELLGEITTTDKTRAFLFQQPDGSQTVVFWSISDLDTGNGAPAAKADELYAAEFVLKAPAGQLVLTDMMGAAQTLLAPADGLRLNATRYPQYLAGLRGLLADKAPAAAGKAISTAPVGNDDLSVVVRLELHPEDMEVGGKKSVATVFKKTLRAQLHIWNLDQNAKTGRLMISGASCEGLPENISLAPMDKASFPVVLTPQLPTEGYNTSLSIAGTFNDKKISTFHLPMLLFGDLMANCEEIPLNAARPENWRRNDSATTSTTSFDEAEQALRFDLNWEKDGIDRWFYPEHVLELPKESFADAFMLAFEVKSSQDKVENDFVHCYLMLVTEDIPEHGTTKTISYKAPMQEWETRYVPLSAAQMPLESIKMIRLGVNPKGQKLTYWVRNLRLLKPRQ